MPMLIKTPDCSLIFVNYRSAAPLLRALNAVFSDPSSHRCEVIVVNGDTREADAVRALADSFPIRLLMLSENLGFGAAANKGAAMATGRILGFLNPDAEITEGSLGDIVSYLDTHPETGIVGACLVDRDGAFEAWSFGRSATLIRLIWNHFRVTREETSLGDRRVHRAEWVSGAALFVRKDLFRRLSGFDERFFLYFEDMDLCDRVREKGFAVARFLSVVFRHVGGASHSSEISKKRFYYDSQDRYFEKHRPAWEASVMRMLRRLVNAHV